jgi:type I restriction enzyme R subunit
VALASVDFYIHTPEERIATYKRDLKFFHNLRASVQFRYAETVDFRDYEQKIRKLLDAHIDAQGVKQLTPEVEIFDTQAFDALVEGLSSPRAQAEAILNHLKRTALEKMETDPAYYRNFSQMIAETLAAIEQQRMSELEALEFANSLRQQETSGQRSDIPERLRHLRDAPAYYGVARECLSGRLSEDALAELAAQIERLIERGKIRDWVDNHDVLNQMRNAIEDYLYQVEAANNIHFTAPELDEIIEQVIDIARKRA